MTVLRRLFPQQFDNRFQGHRLALWLLGLFLALKLMMSVNSIFNTASVAAGADGFRLGSYGGDGARAVLMLFAVVAVGQLMLALLGMAALARYRAMVPFVYLLLVLDQIGRKLLIQSYDIERASETPGSFISAGLLALLCFGMVLSLFARRASDADAFPGSQREI
ncbi:MAG: hypothetical protein M3N39_04135 [Pseudomonadota bacterium]|nr:hypothetical protein [Pseudomonadota bacterium]